jgi:AAA+ ATPase superfamily predicted ATPase
MHSYRDIHQPTININNLLILNGPEKSGKSWFLRHNLKEFAAKNNTLTIHYDIRSVPKSNFSAFLFNFENNIIQEIVSFSKFHSDKKTGHELTIKQALDVLFNRFEKGWIEINISKSLKRAIDINDTAYTFDLDKNNYNDVQTILESLNDYERKSYKEYILIENIEKIIEIISNHNNIDKLQSLLLLIHDCLIQREDFAKPIGSIFENELYRTGITVMDFLFDILNYMAGYHELQSDPTKPKKIYPHVVLGLESVQHLFDMCCSERRPKDYLHYLMLRFYVK